jgi:hypothetical protein
MEKQETLNEAPEITTLFKLLEETTNNDRLAEIRNLLTIAFCEITDELRGRIKEMEEFPDYRGKHDDRKDYIKKVREARIDLFLT